MAGATHCCHELTPGHKLDHFLHAVVVEASLDNFAVLSLGTILYRKIT